MYVKFWSGREDSNLRPLGPKPSALPGCATPRNLPTKLFDRQGILEACQTKGQAVVSNSAKNALDDASDLAR